MDRLTAREKTNSSTRSGPSSFAPSYLEIKGWCGFRDRNTHGLTEAAEPSTFLLRSQAWGNTLPNVEWNFVPDDDHFGRISC